MGVCFPILNKHAQRPTIAYHCVNEITKSSRAHKCFTHVLYMYLRKPHDELRFLALNSSTKKISNKRLHRSNQKLRARLAQRIDGFLFQQTKSNPSRSLTKKDERNQHQRKSVFLQLKLLKMLRKKKGKKQPQITQGWSIFVWGRRASLRFLPPKPDGSWYLRIIETSLHLWYRSHGSWMPWTFHLKT